jgi:hypothetical protein
MYKYICDDKYFRPSNVLRLLLVDRALGPRCMGVKCRLHLRYST